MIAAVTMPTWGLSMERGTVVAWRVAEGGATAPGMELVEIETSKIINTVEAAQAGLLRRQLAQTGETRDCGDLLGVIAGPEVSDADIDAFVAHFARIGAKTAADQSGKLAPEAAFVDLPTGQRLRYLRCEEAGSSVVFIHGFGGDLNTWLFNQPEIARHHSTYAFDLPGHGGSAKSLEHGSIAELAQMVDSALQTLGLEYIHLVGHSLGGAIALALAKLRPERTLSLSLIAPFGLGGSINSEYISGFTVAQRSRDVHRCLSLLFNDPKAVSREMVEAVVQYKRLDGSAEALRQIASAFNDVTPAGPPHSLAALIPNMMVIRATHDKIVKASPLPAGVRLHVVPDAGHMPHMEQPKQVNALLLEHIARADSASIGHR
jgi:pyruvate dehydrogenase E2 component (dihydrolipoamide acetyltransferase)